MSQLLETWADKHAPQTLSDYIFQTPQERAAFEEMVATGSIPNHLLFTGVHGTGKTTLAKILINSLNLDPVDVMVIPASNQNSVDTVRDKIIDFLGTYAMGDYKVVFLDECDMFSLSGQGALRNVLDEYKPTSRFILTGNYVHKIIPAIKSRCNHYRFKAHDKNDVAEMVAKILIEEKVKFTIEQLDAYIDLAYPDVRKIINLVQQNAVKGVLQDPPKGIEDTDYQLVMFDYLEKGQWDELRKHLCASVSSEQWEDVYRFLYENLDKAPTFSKNQQKWEDGIVLLASFMQWHGVVADPEMNFAACLIKLKQLIEEK